MSVAKVRGMEHALEHALEHSLEATRLRAHGLTFREIGAELSVTGPGAH